MTDQQFCLRWNDHQTTLISVFDKLLESGILVDCTLAAEGQCLKAHRVVLSACSPYLESLLGQHYEKHPILILPEVKLLELKYIMDYIYRGEVNIHQDQLKSFFKAAASLQIKGLSKDGTAEDYSHVTEEAFKMTNSVGVVSHSSSTSDNEAHGSGYVKVSPSSKKRKHIRKSPPKGDSYNVEDTHLDTSSLYGLPSQEQSFCIAPNVPENVTSSLTVASPNKSSIKSEELSEVDDPINVNTSLSESGPIKEPAESCKPLLEPKTEYLEVEDDTREDAVEDLALEDNNDRHRTGFSNPSRPHQPYGTSVASASNRSLAPWPYGAAHSAIGEDSAALQGAQSAHVSSAMQGAQSAHVSSAMQVARSAHVSSAMQGPRNAHVSMAMQIAQSAHVSPVMQGAQSVHVSTAMQGAQSAHVSTAMQVAQSAHASTAMEGAHSAHASTAMQGAQRAHVSTAMEGAHSAHVSLAMEGAQSVQGGSRSSSGSGEGNLFRCESCGKGYQHKGNLNRHQRYECGDKRPFVCSLCPFAAKQKNSLQLHVFHNHM